MIVVDTSALIAILQMEDRSAECVAALQTESHILLSAGTLAEALIVAGQRNLTEQLTAVIDEVGIEIVPITETIAYRVAEAYARWGKGNHPARLNFGDCFAYAVAREHACSLLYVGDDFSQTDVTSAL